MMVVQANCRSQFTSEDYDFMLEAFRRKQSERASLVELLSDPETRDLILDDPALFHALLEHRGCLRVSHHFYFYVLVRTTLKRSGIEERDVADYVAEVLAEYSNAERSRPVIPGHKGTVDYFIDMIQALETADDHTRFMIRAHIGNQSLFMTGVFPQRILHRAERRGAPDLTYYEALGQANFRLASDHRLAAKYDLAPVFTTLAAKFRATRLALNDMAERLLTIGENDAYDSFLRATFAGN
jgi:hypothetical protein